MSGNFTHTHTAAAVGPTSARARVRAVAAKPDSNAPDLAHIRQFLGPMQEPFLDGRRSPGRVEVSLGTGRAPKCVTVCNFRTPVLAGAAVPVS